MSVAAHGSSYLTSQHSGKTGSDLTTVVCMDKAQSSQNLAATSHSACNYQQDKTHDSKSIDCTFQYIFLDQYSPNHNRGPRQGHARTLENPLTGLFPKSAKKPPRLFS